jgi:hypothetical protein
MIRRARVDPDPSATADSSQFSGEGRIASAIGDRPGGKPKIILAIFDLRCCPDVGSG